LKLEQILVLLSLGQQQLGRLAQQLRQHCVEQLACVDGDAFCGGASCDAFCGHFVQLQRILQG